MASSAPEQQHTHWGVESLWQDLEPLLPGLSIEVLARIDSTNTALLERVRTQGRHPGDPAPYGRRAHDLQPCLMVAEHQTAGRGRMGRAWHAEPGACLTFSLALPLSLVDWSGLSLAVGAAIAEALDPADASAPRLQLKWPNDIWLQGRKLGGVLIETVNAGDQRIAVVGVGLNIHPQQDTHESHFMSGYASLQELEAGLEAPEVLRRIAAPLIRALTGFSAGGFARWQQRYEQRDLLRGQAVTAGTLEGIAQGINAQGELLLLVAPGGRIETISSGDVSVRLSAAGAASC